MIESKGLRFLVLICIGLCDIILVINFIPINDYNYSVIHLALNIAMALIAVSIPISKIVKYFYSQLLVRPILETITIGILFYSYWLINYPEVSSNKLFLLTNAILITLLMVYWFAEDLLIKQELSNFSGSLKRNDISKNYIVEDSNYGSRNGVAIFFILVTAYLIYYYNAKFNGQDVYTSLQVVASVFIICSSAFYTFNYTLVNNISKNILQRALIVNTDTSIINKLASVKNVVFDQTGTITNGEFQISNAYSMIELDLFKQILKGLEMQSNHAIAKSIVNVLADVEPIEFSGVEEIKGLGVIGKDDYGNTYAVGSYNLAKNLTKEDNHNIYVLKNEKLIGWIDIEDGVRTTAKRFIKYLKNEKINAFLISGNSKVRTENVAKTIGFSDFYFEKLPHEKEEQMVEIQKTGLTMVICQAEKEPKIYSRANILTLISSEKMQVQKSGSRILNLQSNNFDNLENAFKLCKAKKSILKRNIFLQVWFVLLFLPFCLLGYLPPVAAIIAIIFFNAILFYSTIKPFEVLYDL